MTIYRALGEVGLSAEPTVQYEESLGNPDTDGHLLSSTSAGVRSWVQPSSGSGYSYLTEIDLSTSSGTDIDFTIPSGASSVRLHFLGVGKNSTDSPIIQIGDSGGIATSSYTSNGATIASSTGISSSTTGFIIRNSSTIYRMRGTLMLDKLDPTRNSWSCSAMLLNGSTTGSAIIFNTSGTVTLTTGELTTVRLTSSGGAAVFNTGILSASYM